MSPTDSDGRAISPAEYSPVSDMRLRIPVTGGLKISGTLCRPKEDGRFPCLIVYDPYRGAWDGNVGDRTRFVERGYAFVSLHSRGTGSSEGLSLDEYLPEETRDCCEAIDWLARQPWCNGSVGMLGWSYSGFTAVQVAAESPPALKAIAPAYFTDRRYTDDCHYKGGCLRGFYDMLTYGLSMVAMNGLPPHPDVVGDQFHALWHQRLEGNDPYLIRWIQHPLEDEYWRTGSVMERYDRIQAASLLVGGWHDGYVNPPLRTFRALKGPKRLLMGPWNHQSAHIAKYGPRIDYYFELIRWFDHYLKGMDNGVDREPRVAVWVREFEPPVEDRTEVAGRWYFADDLPAFEGDRAGRLWLDTGQLSLRKPRRNGGASYPYLPAACTNGGIWDAGTHIGAPGDQRTDEALAVNFTSDPLEKEWVLLGQPVVILNVSATAEVMPVAVRLCEVAPDGTSFLVTKGILNVTRRNGMDLAQPLPAGNRTELSLELEATAWTFRPGHRIRVSVNGSDFPNVWPTPQPGRVDLFWGPRVTARVSLPLWSASPAEPGREPYRFRPSPNPPPARAAGSQPPRWQVVRDVLERRTRFILSGQGEFCVQDDDPAKAWAKQSSTREAHLPGMKIASTATGILSSDSQSFHMTIARTVSVNEALFHQKEWSVSMKREWL
ncbi:MAG: CocE/NonD family hydrolase [Planctomycetes bacterium]|nr:CocE/NonD family hydrolase [Planctomycetota bacterium]